MENLFSGAIDAGDEVALGLPLSVSFWIQLLVLLSGAGLDLQRTGWSLSQIGSVPKSQTSQRNGKKELFSRYYDHSLIISHPY